MTLPAARPCAAARRPRGVAHRGHPLITKYWTRGEFPHEIIPALRGLGIAGMPYPGIGRRDGSPLLDVREWP